VRGQNIDPRNGCEIHSKNTIQVLT